MFANKLTKKLISMLARREREKEREREMGVSYRDGSKSLNL
jgi:hypothetical protein